MKNFKTVKETVSFYGYETATMENLLTLVLGSKVDLKAVQTIMEKGFAGLLQATKSDLLEVGFTSLMADRILAAVEFGMRVAQEKAVPATLTIRTPKDAANYLMDKLRFKKQEHFVALYLNTKGQVIREKTIFIGGLNSANVHPREIYSEAVKVSAESIVALHNHPSGSTEISRQDIDFTKRLVECGEIMGISLLDHIIIGDQKYVSLKEKGYC